MRKTRFAATLLFLAPVLALAQPAEKVDLNVIHKIKEEALGRDSKVMEHVFYLTDVNGPRLTDSKGYRAAGEWAVKRLQEYGLSNVHLEKWGPFGKAWNIEYYSGHMMEPQYQPIIAYPVAWTPGTNGVVTGSPMMVTPQTPADLDKFKGKLAGKIVMISAKRDLQMVTTPLGVRYTDAELTDIQAAQIQLPGFGRGGRGAPGGPGGGRGAFGQPGGVSPQALQTFLKAEKPALVIQISFNGDGGTLFGGGQSRDANDNLPTIVMAAEHYNRIARLLEHEIPVKLQFEIKASFDDNVDSFNVIAEIPGNAKKDELVMVGGHFDSWHYGTGATDNAAGSSIAMEVMRVLKAANLNMDRTVRMALWGGEEQGLLGSRAYVKEHFADPATMKPTSEHEKFAGYWNVDNGTGKIRGIYLQGNEMCRPIFEKWLEPFRDLGATTITIRNTGGTDHQSFDAVGLPGFQFIQDTMDYNTRTHHSNMDVYDRIQATDLMQMSAIEASMVYLTAVRAEKLPRKPLPPPQPAGGRGGRGGPGGN
ncbi:MAG TPA: M20/M25/M40 family metallo-hydrolase [Candidatus Acidoferrales bacterium]|nr:M20/M25/M40 family metallo-hydrolase [Candidatus Acidoferrales bacterium]